MQLTSRWVARSGAARPRRPRAAPPRPRQARRSPALWRPASAGASRASARPSCACCRPAPAARRERRAALPRARRADVQARAVAPEVRGRARRRAEGARGRPRRRPALRRHAAHRRAQHGGRTAQGQDRAAGPFGPQDVALMAQAISPASGRRYGVRRACQVWDVPRSSFYAARRPVPDAAAPPAPARRGPQPTISDEALLAAIRKDFDLSPWTGEGHRKVWARLRGRDGIRVSRKRVLRLMRERALLSPHRARPRREAAHDRHIVTAAPNIMWAIDATQVTTVQDGKVWLFGVAEHWNAELLGWHVAKSGDRFEAI